MTVVRDVDVLLGRGDRPLSRCYRIQVLPLGLLLQNSDLCRGAFPLMNVLALI